MGDFSKLMVVQHSYNYYFHNALQLRRRFRGLGDIHSKIIISWVISASLWLCNIPTTSTFTMLFSYAEVMFRGPGGLTSTITVLWAH